MASLDLAKVRLESGVWIDGYGYQNKEKKSHCHFLAVNDNKDT